MTGKIFLSKAAKFFTVKEYIRNNPHATIRDVADANEVSVNQIQQWVREERLQFSSDSGVALQCEKCGAKIYTGRYCDKCKAGLANGLTKAFSDDKKHAEPKKKGLLRLVFSRLFLIWKD